MKEGMNPNYTKSPLEQRLEARLSELGAIENKTPEQWQATLQTARTLDTIRGSAYKLLSAFG
jgi:hypothetical protein